MADYENRFHSDRLAYLARLGYEISAERKRLACELRNLLNERRLERNALPTNETSILQYSE